MYIKEDMELFTSKKKKRKNSECSSADPILYKECHHTEHLITRLVGMELK